MKPLELIKTPANPFSDGASKYNIPCLIKRSDVKNFGIDKDLVGTVITRKPNQWAKITGDNAGTIRMRAKAEEGYRARGVEERDWRIIAGLDPMIVNSKVRTRKVSSVNDKSRALNWLYDK